MGKLRSLVRVSMAFLSSPERSSHRGDSQRKKLATAHMDMNIQGASITIWYWNRLVAMCNCTPYTQKVDTISAIPMHTEYHAVSSPRISAGAISTMEIVPVTLNAPIPSPETTRDTYSIDAAGLIMAISCPSIHTKVYNRKDLNRPIRSLRRNDSPAPTASPIYTSEMKLRVEPADSELIPNCCWNPCREGNVDAEPWSHAIQPHLSSILDGNLADENTGGY